MSQRTEQVPCEWLDVLLSRGANFEILRPVAGASLGTPPRYVTDGRRCVAVKVSRQTTPYSGAVAVDYRLVEVVQ
jgi:hypothetical protein